MPDRSLTVLERILAGHNNLHVANESSDYTFSRSLLPMPHSTAATRFDYSISPIFARHLLQTIEPGMTTLETGRGVSTLIFAARGARHTTIAPHTSEQDSTRDCATRHQIDLSQTTFINETSEQYLPTMPPQDFDIVFLDGKHAFPWPMIDWHYTAEHLKVGGLMMVDDIQLRPIAVLCDFLRHDPKRWRYIATIDRTMLFKKLSHPIWDISWIEQPWVTQWKRPMMQRLLGRIRRHIQSK